jgi:hypothetical protein
VCCATLGRSKHSAPALRKQPGAWHRECDLNDALAQPAYRARCSAERRPVARILSLLREPCEYSLKPLKGRHTVQVRPFAQEDQPARREPESRPERSHSGAGAESCDEAVTVQTRERFVGLA